VAPAQGSPEPPGAPDGVAEVGTWSMVERCQAPLSRRCHKEAGWGSVFRAGRGHRRQRHPAVARRAV